MKYLDALKTQITPTDNWDPQAAQVLSFFILSKLMVHLPTYGIGVQFKTEIRLAIDVKYIRRK